MERVLAILTKDVAFGHTLAEYILNSHVLKYKVIPFYDMADYLQYADTGDVEVLLADEEFSEKLALCFVGRLFVLTEEKQAEENTIFKYQSMEITVKELSFMLYAAGNEDAPKNNRFTIRSVASEKGGSGVSTFALTLAGVLGRKQSVLLVSLDPFVKLPVDLETGEGELGELVFGLGTGRTDKRSVNSSHLVSGCIHHGRDFDYVSGVLTFEDLCYFGREEMRSFLAWLAGDGRYQTVIFDMGSFPLCAGVVLEKSESIYLVGEENGMMISQLDRLLAGNSVGKTVNVKMPYVKDFREGNLSYSDYENTELWDYVSKLLAEKTEEKGSVTEDESCNLPVVRDVSDVPAATMKKGFFGKKSGGR